jgi:hypothetical protein
MQDRFHPAPGFTVGEDPRGERCPVEPAICEPERATSRNLQLCKDLGIFEQTGHHPVGVEYAAISSLAEESGSGGFPASDSRQDTHDPQAFRHGHQDALSLTVPQGSPTNAPSRSGNLTLRRG